MKRSQLLLGSLLRDIFVAVALAFGGQKLMSTFGNQVLFNAEYLVRCMSVVASGETRCVYVLYMRHSSIPPHRI
jgi:hypothetical protein